MFFSVLLKSRLVTLLWALLVVAESAAVFSLYHWVLDFTIIYAVLSTVASELALVLVFFKLLFTA